MEWTIIIPRTPPSANSKEWNNRWSKREIKADWERDIYYLCKEQKVPHFKRVTVSAVIYFAKGHRRDLDNYESTLKKMSQDALVISSVILDDTPEHISWGSVKMAVGQPSRTELIISSLVS